MPKYVIECGDDVVIIKANTINGALQIFVRYWYTPENSVSIKKVTGEDGGNEKFHN